MSFDYEVSSKGYYYDGVEYRIATMQIRDIITLYFTTVHDPALVSAVHTVEDLPVCLSQHMNKYYRRREDIHLTLNGEKTMIIFKETI